MTPEESRGPATRSDFERLEKKVDKVLMVLHGDGTRENVGLFHIARTNEEWRKDNKDLPARVKEIEGWQSRTQKHIASLWTGGLTVATVVGGAIAEYFRNRN